MLKASQFPLTGRKSSRVLGTLASNNHNIPMLKKLLFIFTLTLIFLTGSVALNAFKPSLISWKTPPISEVDYQTGDIIFQSSKSGQGLAIQLATGSKFSHVGMLIEQGGEIMVFEAVQPVRLTKMSEFVKRGEGGNFVVSRLKNADQIWTDQRKQEVNSFVKKHVGKDYDLLFDWSDEKMYCSELVWKLYKEVTGLEISELKPLKAYDLSHPEVQKQMNSRYGKSIPLDEPMIAPGALFDSDLFEVIRDTDC
jgi:hypothetical protein